MALTLAQAFIGVLTVGIGLSRGLEADVGVHGERLNGDANYAASRIAAGHAKASNAIADDNVLAAAMMGPRLAVEADVITMDQNAAASCPWVKEVCEPYTANRPRAEAKLQWIRNRQMSIWGSLEMLSSQMNKVSGAQAKGDVTRLLASLDPGARMSFADPTDTKDPFASRSAFTGCTIAKRDAELSPMVGHAFPLLMPNLLGPMPWALVETLPNVMCPPVGEIAGAVAGAASSMSAPPISLPGIPAVDKQTKASCDRVEEHMRAQVGERSGGVSSKEPTFSSDVMPFVKCVTAKPGGAPLQLEAGQVAFTVKKKGQLYTCTFDKKECNKKMSEVASADFLKSIGLPAIPSFATIGGSTRSPAAARPNESDDFRAAATASEAPNATTADIADAARTLLTFGGTAAPTILHREVSRKSTGKWYFPDGAGPLAAVPPDQRAFVAGWKHALVSSRGR